MPFPVLARPVRDSGFDAEEIKRWLGQCDKTHGMHCWVTPDQRLSRIGMRLIDTEQNCLVRVTGHCAYTALTYVWGPVDQPVLILKRGLIMEWETPGYFCKIDLPKTISDSIKVCQMIGLKYLWVDSLCIVQDDPLAVQEQINSMSLVYSQAYLTMIAASGDDCDSGLSSVQAREPIQKTFQAGDLQMGTTFLSLKQELVKSKWNTRAWTLQEYALSCRCLVFTPRQVFFCCAEGIRREDVNRHLVSCWYPALRPLYHASAPRLFPIAQPPSEDIRSSIRTPCRVVCNSRYFLRLGYTKCLLRDDWHSKTASLPLTIRRGHPGRSHGRWPGVVFSRRVLKAPQFPELVLGRLELRV